MKKYIKWIVLAVVVIAAVVVLSESVYTVNENEYACVVRFSKIENTVSTSGLHFKVPFVDTIRKYSKAAMLYDIPPSEVLTSDKKNMTVDSYVLWKIEDPLKFFQTLGTTGEAQSRLDAITYNALKKTMGTLEQNAIINQEDAEGRNDIYEAIAQEVKDIATTYGIHVMDVKVKRFDLPELNEQAVYTRMISDRDRIAQKYLADGEKEATMIRNEVDKNVNILLSEANVRAAQLEAEGEAEYMRLLGEAYDSADKKDFYEFMLAIDAIKTSLNGDETVLILGRDSKLVQMLINPQQ